MSQGKYQIVVSGRVVEGVDLAVAKQQVAKLFGSDISKIGALFSGKFVVVKKGLDEAGAKKYMQALKRAGLVSTAQLARPPESAAILAPVGETLDKTPSAPSANINTNHISVANVGETLVSPQTVPEPNIDTSKLAVAQVGVELDRSPLPDAPDIDISAIGMAEVGVELDNKLKPSAPHIDVSGLTIAETGSTIVEPTQVPKANIDTSKLVLLED